MLEVKNWHFALSFAVRLQCYFEEKHFIWRILPLSCDGLTLNVRPRPLLFVSEICKTMTLLTISRSKDSTRVGSLSQGKADAKLSNLVRQLRHTETMVEADMQTDKKYVSWLSLPHRKYLMFSVRSRGQCSRVDNNGNKTKDEGQCRTDFGLLKTLLLKWVKCILGIQLLQGHPTDSVSFEAHQ